MALTKAAAATLAAATPNIHGNAFTKREAEAIAAAESYTPTTSADWSVVPTAQDAGLDELAERVTDLEARSDHDEGVDNLALYAIGYMTAAELVAAGTGVAAVCFGATSIPDNAIILDGLVDVLTIFAGDNDDSSTIAIHVNGANDLVTATAISAGGAIWDPGLHAVGPVGTAATAIKLTAARDISVTWTANADTTLSTGEMRIILRYIVSG